MVRATPANIAEAALYDPEEDRNIVVVAYDSSLHPKRLSGRVVVALLLANKKWISQTQICKFNMVFKAKLVIREGSVNEGSAAIAPDGGAICIREGEIINGPEGGIKCPREIIFNGGDENLRVSLLSWDELRNDPKHEKWQYLYLFAYRRWDENTLLTRAKLLVAKRNRLRDSRP
jgi:hypothetical protein